MALPLCELDESCPEAASMQRCGTSSLTRLGTVLTLLGLLSFATNCTSTYHLQDALSIVTGRRLQGSESGRDYYTLHAIVRLPEDPEPRMIEFRAWNDHHVSHPLRRSAFQVVAQGQVLRTITVNTEEVTELYAETTAEGWGSAGGDQVRIKVPGGVSELRFNHVWGDWFCAMEISDLRLIGHAGAHPCDLSALGERPLAERPSLAILDFAVGRELSEDVGRAIADLCRDVAQDSHQFRLVDREHMTSILSEQDFVAAVDCDDTQCIVQYGRLLGAQYMLHGRVNQLGDVHVLAIHVTDVNTSQQASSSTTVDALEQSHEVLPELVCDAIRRTLGL